MAFVLGIATLIAMAAVSAATPFLHYDYWQRWFSLRAFPQLPRSVAGSHHGGGVFLGLARGSERVPS